MAVISNNLYFPSSQLRIFGLAIIFQLTFILVQAQRVDYMWARSFGGYKGDFGISIAVDGSGNLYSTGYFYGSVDFDPGPGVSLLIAGKFGTAFLTKWDKKGNFIWAKTLADGGPNSVGMSVAVDESGNVFTAGSFGGTSDFDPGPGIFELSSADSVDLFVSKLDADGNFIWAKQFIGDAPNNIRQMRLDKSGHVYITGVFEGTMDFDPGPGIFKISNLDGASFLTKLDTNGNFLWARSYFIIYSFDIDHFDQIITAGSGNLTPSRNNENDIILQKLDASGNNVWAVSFGGLGNDFVTSVAVDGDGNVYTTGRYIGEADMDPGPQTFTCKDPGNDGEIFISKLDKNGQFQWAKHFGLNWRNPGFDPAALDVDSKGNPYLTGDFNGSVDFDPGACDFRLEASDGYMYVLKLDNSGNMDWVKQIGGKKGEARPSSIVLDHEDNIYTTGWYNKTVDMDPGASESLFTFNDTDPSFGGDIFVHKMGPRPACKNSTIDAYVCGNYTVGCNTYTTSGIYTQRIELPDGCDSVITINLTIGRVIKDTTITTCRSYLWNDTLITQTGFYSRLFRTPNGCDSIMNLNLMIIPVSDTLITTTICKGQSFLGYTVSGNYIDTLVAANGCDSIRNLQLKVLTPPKPDLGPDKAVCIDDPLTLDAGPFDSYRWMDGSTQRQFRAERPGLYEVTVSNACGSGNDQIVLTNGICDIYFPTAFTPDNNGRNDQFRVLGDLKFQYYYLIVFDRWGRKIFETKDPARGWDGRSGGMDMPIGSYPWQCNYRTTKDPSNKLRHGTTSLIR